MGWHAAVLHARLESSLVWFVFEPYSAMIPLPHSYCLSAAEERERIEGTIGKEVAVCGMFEKRCSVNLA